MRKTFFVETLSMNFVMAGMIPLMLVLAVHWEGSENPANPAFWFRMSLAAILGGLLAYPINYWLVKNHLKHGCMTLPNADGPAPGLGHHSPEPGAMPHDGAQGQHSQHQGHHHGHHEGHMEMKDLSLGAKCLWIAFSFAFLFLALWIANHWAPIRF